MLTVTVLPGTGATVTDVPVRTEYWVAEPEVVLARMYVPTPATELRPTERPETLSNGAACVFARFAARGKTIETVFDHSEPLTVVRTL
jgi:hypothetical protein